MLAYLLHILVIMSIYIILTLSLNLIIGFSGQVSLGHAAFYGIGAYISSVLVVNFSFPYAIALPAAAVGAGLFGMLLGIPTLRLKDDYLAIVTLGFGLILVVVALNIDYVGGTEGFMGIPSPMLFGIKFASKARFLAISLVLVALTILFMYRIKASRIGRALSAVRDDETVAQVMGINTTKYKVMAFGIGSAFAGIAGSLYSAYVHFIDPHTFGLSTSIVILCMVVLGGIGSIAGSIIGAAILTFLPELLRIVIKEIPGISDKIPDFQALAYGLLLVFIIIIRPQGLMGKSKTGRKFSLNSLFGIKTRAQD
jgi:branched-chain amino acid transport system permease protein